MRTAGDAALHVMQGKEARDGFKRDNDFKTTPYVELSEVSGF